MVSYLAFGICAIFHFSLLNIEKRFCKKSSTDQFPIYLFPNLETQVLGAIGAIVGKFWKNKIFISIILFSRYLVMWKTSWPFLNRYRFFTGLYCSGPRNTLEWQLVGIWSRKQCKWICSVLQWSKKHKRMTIG